MRRVDDLRLATKLPVFAATLGALTILAPLLLAPAIGQGTTSLGISSTLPLAGAAAAVGAVAWLMASWLLTPLKSLRYAAEQIALGNLDVDVSGTRRGDAFGVIASGLDRLRGNLVAARETERQGFLRHAALDACSAAIMMVDRDGRITFVNQKLDAVLRRHNAALKELNPSFDPNSVIGSAMDAFHPNNNHVARLLSDRENLPYTADIRLGDTDFALRISAIVDSDGQYVGNAVEWQDVSEVRLQAALIRTIDENLLTAHVDPDGSVIQINETFETCIGQTVSEVAGTPMFDILRTETENEKPGILERLQSGQRVGGVFRLDRADGSPRWIEGSFNPVLNRSGVPVRHLFLGNDTTDVTAELAAADQRRKAMEAQQAEVVNSLRVALKDLAEGNLTVSISDCFPNDYEQLRMDFNTSVSRLLTAMLRVVENAAAIRGETKEIDAAAEDLSRRSETQAATLEQTAAALDELTASVTSAANGAARARKMVEDTRANAERSGEIVEQAVEAMRKISESSEQVSRIIGVIDEIALQTNLLALNAGVEAARAGDAGRGFAVVASEVRSLAQRSSSAAQEISALISASGQHVRTGVDLVGETGTTLKRIVEGVKEVAGHVSEIAVAATQQSTGLSEINTAVNQLDQVAQQNAAMFAETTAASNALQRSAGNLSETISLFKTGAVAAESHGKMVRGTVPGIKTERRRAVGAAVAGTEDELDAAWDDF